VHWCGPRTADYDSGVERLGGGAPGQVRTFGVPRTSFVGRGADVVKVVSLLSEHRLVTVTGPGGVGKTRLASAVAQEVAGRFADGAWLAELAACSDPGLIPGLVADALGLQLAPGVGLADLLARRQLLVVLDNCEHVLDAAATFCESLLAAADDVRVLATSREPLGVAGESRYRLGPLRLPELDDDSAAPPNATRGVADAVTLFADRARLADPAFVVDVESAPLVAQIVTALDGMPLAIELAAARVESLGLDQLSARLEDRLRLLIGSGRTAGSRHASLTAAADWSYRLLAAEQQRVFRVLSVFPGPFTLDAAEAIAGPLAGTAVLHLVDCSLLVPPRVGPDGRARYVMLETLRAFGSERLHDAGEQGEVYAALARYAADVAEAAAVDLLTTAGEPAAVSWLDAESATLQRALSWALQHEGHLALRLAISLAYWWHMRSRQAEGYWLLYDAARQAERNDDRWCAAQFWLGWLSADSGMNMTAFELHMTAVIDVLTERVVRAPLLARALAFRAVGVANQDRFLEAAEDAQRALDLAIELGDPFAEAFSLYALGYVADRARDVEALAWYRRTQEVDLATVPGWLARYCLASLGAALSDYGEFAEARHHCDRALALANSAGTLSGEGTCLVMRAGIEVKSGDLEAARLCLASAINLYLRSGAALLLWNILEACVELTGRLERWRERVTLSAAWKAMNASTLQITMPADRVAAAARAALGAADAEAAERRGAAMTAEAAVAYALEAIADEPAGRDNGKLVGGPPLSARERELVLLVAQGRTDAQIAEQLFISIRTVRSHLDRIRDKTGCRRRADLTRLALQAGLI
jgi:predicted ATPase/DNA-binding CsgD family transcriptional regulator